MGDFDLRNSNGTRMAGIVEVDGRAIGLRHALSKAQLRHHLPLLYLDVYENGRKLKPDVALGADGSVIFRNDKRAIRIRLSEKEFANPGRPTIRLTIHDVAQGTLGDQPRAPTMWKVRLSLVP
jgi:hypothetical protein